MEKQIWGCLNHKFSYVKFERQSSEDFTGQFAIQVLESLLKTSYIPHEIQSTLH